MSGQPRQWQPATPAAKHYLRLVLAYVPVHISVIYILSLHMFRIRCYRMKKGIALLCSIFPEVSYFQFPFTYPHTSVNICQYA